MTKLLIFSLVVLCFATVCIAQRNTPGGTVTPCRQTPAVVGICRGAFPRYSYHPRTNTCRHFIYGGCHGNDNNFKTLAECEATCKPR